MGPLPSQSASDSEQVAPRVVVQVAHGAQNVAHRWVGLLVGRADQVERVAADGLDLLAQGPQRDPRLASFKLRKVALRHPSLLAKLLLRQAEALADSS